jgi:hypothetical protein
VRNYAPNLKNCGGGGPVLSQWTWRPRLKRSVGGVTIKETKEKRQLGATGVVIKKRLIKITIKIVK